MFYSDEDFMIAFGNSKNDNEVELRIGDKGCRANPGRAFDLPVGFKRGSQEALFAINKFRTGGPQSNSSGSALVLRNQTGHLPF